MNHSFAHIIARQHGLTRLVTGKMSHDLNNIIGAMTGAISVLERQFSDDEKAMKRIGLLKKSVVKSEEFSDLLGGLSSPDERRIESFSFDVLVQKFKTELESSGLCPLVTCLDMGDDLDITVRGNEPMIYGLFFHAVALLSWPVKVCFTRLHLDSPLELSSGSLVAPGTYAKAQFVETGGRSDHLSEQRGFIIPLPPALLQVILSINTTHFEHINEESTGAVTLYMKSKNPQ